MALSLPRLRRTLPVPAHGGGGMPAGAALIYEVTQRRRQWRAWILVEAALLALEGFLALAAIVAALVVASGVAGRLGPRLLAVAALIAAGVAVPRAKATFQITAGGRPGLALTPMALLLRRLST